jgi:integrase
MPAKTRGSVFTAGDGYGIRWPEDGKRPQQTGFRTKTEARDWFNEHVAPRLRRGAPSADTSFDAFCIEFLARWEPTAATRTRKTFLEWLGPARKYFGAWRLAEITADDVARWRRTFESDHARYRHTRALRQVLAAAVRWGYLTRNPAVDFGKNAQPHAKEINPFTHAEIDAIAQELGPIYGPLVLFAAETGLRTNEWIALERRDIDRRVGVVVVCRRVTDGELYPMPKNHKRRRVPLTAQAVAALDALPPRLDTQLVFPAPDGGYIDLSNWRAREWYPALEAAGIARRGPYALRHTFASEALAAGISIFQLARVMGASVAMIDHHYGHLVPDSEDAIRALLSRRDGVDVASHRDA